MRLATDNLDTQVKTPALRHQLLEISTLPLTRHRCYELQIGLALCQQARCPQKAGGVVLQLRHAATRQDADHSPGLLQAQALARCDLIWHHRDHFRQRMPDIGHRHTCPPIEFFLERKNHQHVGHRTRNFLDPTTAPGPDLRTNEVHGRNAGLTQLQFETEIETRIVNPDKSGWSLRQQLVTQGILNTLDFTIAWNHFEQTAHSQLIHRPVADKTMLSHQWSADSVQTSLWQSRPQAG